MRDLFGERTRQATGYQVQVLARHYLHACPRSRAPTCASCSVERSGNLSGDQVSTRRQRRVRADLGIVADLGEAAHGVFDTATAPDHAVDEPGVGTDLAALADRPCGPGATCRGTG